MADSRNHTVDSLKTIITALSAHHFHVNKAICFQDVEELSLALSKHKLRVLRKCSMNIPANNFFYILLSYGHL